MLQDALGYYQILEVNDQSSAAEIKRQYRDKAKLYHPDYNKSAAAVEIFQQLSEAYEVLSNDDRRLIYNLLSAVYDKNNYPELENIQPFKSPASDSVDIRFINPMSVRGKLWRYTVSTQPCYCTLGLARKHELKVSVLNWLLGWWQPKAFVLNCKYLCENFRHVDYQDENLRLLVHNAVAYNHLGQQAEASRSAVLALSYAQGSLRTYLQQFIARLNQRVARPQSWPLLQLKLVQLLMPLLIFLAVFLPSSVEYVSEWDLMQYFRNKKAIDYYQEVNFGRRGRSVDDVVVGKVLTIPVDRTDIKQLYHLRADAQIMYGPSDEFDIFKPVKSGTTVRLTGVTPDKIWARIMIDSGEMGFVKMQILQRGMGNPVPDFSKVYEPE